MVFRVPPGLWWQCMMEMPFPLQKILAKMQAEVGGLAGGGQAGAAGSGAGWGRQAGPCSQCMCMRVALFTARQPGWAQAPALSARLWPRQWGRQQVWWW